MKILIADDHAIVRKGLKQILIDEEKNFEIDEACNGFEVLEKIVNNRYDILVLDISMPGKSGLDVLKDLRSRGFNIPVLVLSIHAEDQYALRAFRAGASGYVVKNMAPEELVKAVETVHSGKKYITSSLAEKLVEELALDERELYKKLSDREFQVFLGIVQGKSSKELGDELNLSIKTISTYRSRILEKMGMNNNIELTRYAVNTGIIE